MCLFLSLNIKIFHLNIQFSYLNFKNFHPHVQNIVRNCVNHKNTKNKNKQTKGGKYNGFLTHLSFATKNFNCPAHPTKVFYEHSL